MLKRVAVVVAVLALGWACIRSAAVASSSERRPQLAEAFWPSHPLPTRARALGAIGAAAAKGQPAPASALAEMNALARREPLAEEPFTIAGTAALAGGRVEQAGRLLGEAIERDPRALAPRYLLADLLLRSGDVEGGLQQVLFLTRQVGRMAEPVAPALARFARQPGGVAQLRPVLDRNPAMRDAVLLALATDPSAADLVLALAGPPSPSPTRETQAWQERLLAGFTDRGDYRAASRLWSRLTGAELPATGLFNPSFGPNAAPPPFNWFLASGSSGIAEPLPGGGVRLLFYGREEAVLASQIVLLPPGRFRLTWRSTGPSDNLIVRASCMPGDRPLASTPLQGGRLEMVVPPACQAQRIEFRGQLADLPVTVQPSVTGLRLTEAGRP